jgi:O-antigen ligase
MAVMYFASIIVFSFQKDFVYISTIIGLLTIFLFFIYKMQSRGVVSVFIPIESRLILVFIGLILITPGEQIFDRLDLPLTLFKLFVLVTVFSQILLESDNLFKIPFYGLLIGLAYTSGDLFTTVIADSTRLGSVIKNPNVYAAYLIFISMVSYAYLHLSGKPSLKKKALLFVIVILSMTQILVYTGSRKGIILGVLMILYFSYKNMINAKGLLRKFFLFIMLIVSIYIGAGYISETPYWHRVENILHFADGNAADTSITERWTMLLQGLELFSESPIYGWGAKGYESLSTGFLGYKSYSHSNYIELMANHGIVGLFIYYSIFMTVLVKLFRRSKIDAQFRENWANWGYVMIGYLLIFDIQAVTYYDKLTWIIYLVVLALLYKPNKFTENF